MATSNIVVRACFGAMLVFYNTTVIAYSLPFVAKALFVSTVPVESALNILGLLAAGYLAKPVAQAISGTYADRHGRKKVLVFASAATVFTSVALALLPAASAIGVASPIVFTLITAAQAAIAGAEWPLLAAYIAESTPDQKRGVLTSAASFSVCFGWLLAIIVPLLLHAVLNQAQYAQWGWRVAFLPAIVLALVAYALRRGLPESPQFVLLQQSHTISAKPLVELFRRQAAAWVLLVLHVGAISACFFLTVSFPVVFVVLADKFSHVESLLIGMTGLTVMVLGIVFAGRLADRFGPRPIGGAGFALIMILAYPAYWLMAQGQLPAAMLGVALLGAALALSAGVYEAWTVSPFRVRYTGAALTCNGVAVGLFGTSVLWLATRIAHLYGHMAPVSLAIAAGLLGLVTTQLLPRSIHEPLEL